MKKVISILGILVLAGVLVYGAYVGFPVSNKNDQKLDEVKLSDYVNEQVVTLGEYKNLTVDVEYTVITEQDVIDYVNEVLAYYPEYQATEDTVVDEGDFVDLAYAGYLNDEKFDESESYVLEIGSDTFIDGFEDGLIGAKVGDVVTLNLTFPEDYKDYYGNISELAGKETVFSVTINAIVEEVVLTYDTVSDEYCKENYGFDTKQKLYDYVKEMMEEDVETEKESSARTILLETIVNNCTVVVPQELLDYQVNNYITSFKTDVEAAGYDYAEYLETYYKFTEEEFIEEISTYMKESITEQLILSAIAKAENITLDEKGYAEYVAAFVSYYGYETEEELYADYSKDEMQTAYLCNDVLDYLIENATFNYVEKAETDDKIEEQ